MHLPDLTAKRAELNGDKVALVDLATGTDITYSELDDRASRAAEFLRDEWGVRAGDRVATLAQNRTETIELLFACAKLHAVLVPLNWRLARPELEYILADAAAIGLVSDDVNADMAARLVSDVPGAKGPLRSMAFGASPRDCGCAYEQVIGQASGRKIVHEPRDESELWYLMYTSGTTGKPKGVQQTAGMALVNHLNIGTAAGITSEDVFLSVLPQFHTGGWNLYALPMIFVGGTTLMPRTFDPGECLALLKDRVSVFFGVPTNYQMLADHPDFAHTDLTSVRSWSAGGAAMPVPLIRRLDAAGVQVRQGMGMTETGPTVFLLDAGDAITKAGSVGKPQPFVDVRIVDGSAKDVAPGERGELLIRGPGVTPGYWRLPEATRDAVDEDGWLRSGDIALQDAEGFFYIVDRAKDMYISGAENVYPAEVEAVVNRIPGVIGCAVVGVPDERWGEVGKAVIEVAAGATVDIPTVRDFCREHLARYKVPQYVDIVDVLPRNAMGKIQKHMLHPTDSSATPGNSVGTEWLFERTITQDDLNGFADISGDDNPIHVDAAYAATTPFARPVAHGMFLFSLVRSQLRRRWPGARLAEQQLTFSAPTPVGSSVTIRLQVVGDNGNSLRVATTVTSQDGPVGLVGECVLDLDPEVDAS